MHGCPLTLTLPTAQIQVEDVVISVNGNNVQESPPSEVRAMLAKIGPGVAVTLGLRRPAINGEMENGLVPMVQTQSPSPEPSPSQRRRRPVRAPAVDGVLGHGLDNIPESHSLDIPATADKRHSLTPEMNRKTFTKPVPLKSSKSLDLSSLPQWRRQSTQMVHLQNLIDETELTDRLHDRSRELKVRQLWEV